MDCESSACGRDPHKGFEGCSFAWVIGIWSERQSWKRRQTNVDPTHSGTKSFAGRGIEVCNTRCTLQYGETVKTWRDIEGQALGAVLGWFLRATCLGWSSTWKPTRMSHMLGRWDFFWAFSCPVCRACAVTLRLTRSLPQQIFGKTFWQHVSNAFLVTCILQPCKVSEAWQPAQMLPDSAVQPHARS